MLNRWELEEDDDSDGEFPIQRPKTSSGGRSPGPSNVAQSHQRSDTRQSNQNGFRNHLARTSASSGVSDASSRGLYTDDDDDDLDAEELQHGPSVRNSVGQGRQNGGNNSERPDSYVAKNIYTNISKGPNAIRSLASMETITIQELDDAFGDGLSNAASSRTPGGEVEVDKIELARAVRYIGVPALADDILNIATWRVSWNVLLAVARPYTLRDNSDGMPIKGDNSPIQQILKPRGPIIGPSNLSRQSSGDLKSKRLSVAFEPLESDNEKEQMRPKTAMRSQDLPSRNQFSPVVSSSSDWTSQIRQPRDLKVTKSMDEESWHDADRSRSFYSEDNNGNRSNKGHGPQYSTLRQPREDLSMSPDVNKSSQSGTGKRWGEQSPTSELQSSIKRTQNNSGAMRTEAQMRWAGGEGDRNDSNSDDSRNAEDEAYDKYDNSQYSPPQRMPQRSPGGSPATQRKTLSDPSEGGAQRRQDSQPLTARPKSGSMSPLLFPKPTALSHSPSIPKSRESKANMTGSDDSSLASGPHPMASSWETAVSPRSEEDQSGDGKGQTPAKPPRPQSLQAHLPPAFAAEKPMRPSMSITPAMSLSKSLYGDRDRTQMKRSISWSAAVSSEFAKPPRTKSASYILSSSFNSASWDGEGPEGYGDNPAASQDLDRHLVLSPLSEYALRTGVIIEGWLEKKSAVTGFWQKRYFVLAESSTEFCELRIYYKVVESSWGTIPLKKKASIPIGTVRSVAPISTKIKQGKQFSVTFKIFDGEKSSPSGLLTRSRRGSDATLGSRPGDGSEAGEGDSDGDGDGNGNSRSKSMILKAEDLKTRMLWTTMLGKVLRYHTGHEPGEEDYVEDTMAQ